RHHGNKQLHVTRPRDDLPILHVGVTHMHEAQAVERLIRMEAKLDSHLYRTTQAEQRLDNHDSRIRTLETGHARTIGIAAGASAVVSLAVELWHKLAGG